MNREIKFRAYFSNDKYKCMIYDEFEWAIMSTGKYLEYDESDRWVKKIPKYEPIIMQYTGRKDSNNKNVYEGDIVKYWGGIGKVIYFDQYAAFMILHGDNDLFELHIDVEVIGNVFQNPELLK